ncbi:MAG: dihydroneopterin aldolase [Ruminococcaceae bacterium]|nr:dihydroneopterin aldolase [Oscillospiraceae bacterium]
MDKIVINGLTLKAHHGVAQEEKDNGQIFILDIVASLDLSKARKTDDLNDTENYSKMIGTIKAVFLSEKNDLIEHAAERVADALLKNYNKIESVTVLLKKPQAPINAEFQYVGVEITKSRGI